MATNPLRLQQGYGIGNALQPLAPFTIIANRAPTTSDKAKLGTLWDYKTGVAATDEVYMLTSVTGGQSNWKLLSNGGGAAVFTSLTVNGASIFTGAITQTAGTVEIGRDAAAQTLYFGTGGAVKTVNIGSTNTTSATNINAGSNGITLLGTVVRVTNPGSFRSVPVVVTPVDAAVNTTCNGFAGSVRFNRAATFIAAPGALLPPFDIANAAIIANAAVLVTVQTEDGNQADCMLRVAQVLVTAGNIRIYVANDAAAGGNSDCTLVVINFVVMV